MNKIDERKITFKFVPMGTLAPPKGEIPYHEFWLDVGGRSSGQVYDHHGGDTEAWSATALVYENREKFLPLSRDRAGAISFVLHENPDIDAIGAAWLALHWINQHSETDDEHIYQIVEQISYNDQGMAVSDSPLENWVIIIRTILGYELNDLTDDEKVKSGLRLLQKTFGFLKKGNSLKFIAKKITTQTTKIWIQQAIRDYQEDLSRARVFQLNLPIEIIGRKIKVQQNCPQEVPAATDTRWTVADALFLRNPRSSLFKELARFDKSRSPMGDGFALLIVQTGPHPEDDYQTNRYVISTNPYSGFNLKGLGKLLEEKEQAKEDDFSRPLREGRERVPPDQGRHGYNVLSPWYDGRGHNFSIIDSPTFSCGDQNFCGSLLSPEEVLETIWDYGNPLRFKKMIDGEFYLIHAIDIVEKKPPIVPWELIPSEGFFDDYSPEVKIASGSLKRYRNPSEVDFWGNKVVLKEQQIWEFYKGLWLWVGIFKLSNTLENLEMVAEATSEIIRDKTRIKNLLPEQIRLKIHGRFFPVTHVRTDDFPLAYEKLSDLNRIITSPLLNCVVPDFRNLPTFSDLQDISQVLSKDHRQLCYVSTRGAVSISTRIIRLKNETGFYSPSALTGLLVLIIAKKIAYDQILENFSAHCFEPEPKKAAKFLMRDRWDLLYISESLCFTKVTEDRFGSELYERASERIINPKLTDHIETKIETFSNQVRDSLTTYKQKIAFLVTTLFAPLALTFGFFSGVHMDRRFAVKYYTFFPTDWHPFGFQASGWMMFLIVFGVLSLMLTSLWALVTLSYRKRNMFTSFLEKRRKRDR